MKIIVSVLAAMLLSGCISNTDPETVWLLNRRVSDMEGGKVQPKQASQAVRPPQVQQNPFDGSNYVIIYVPIKNGAYKPVKIIQTGYREFRGPLGELYLNSVPTIEQLKQIY